MYHSNNHLIRLIIITLLSTKYGIVFCCKNVTLKNAQGTITSPSYPLQYLPNLDCTWTIQTDADRLISIRLLDVNIEKNTSCYNNSSADCCTDSWLQIGDRKFCGNLTRSTVLSFAATSVKLSFVSREAANAGAGFLVTYSVRPALLCAKNLYQCFDMKKCFRDDEICDSVFQCEDHSDEINCGQCRESLTRCNIYSETCFDPRMDRCNGVRDCPKGEDEYQCSFSVKKEDVSYFEKESVNVGEEKSSLFWIVIIVLVMAFSYLILRWWLHRRDVRRCDSGDCDCSKCR